LDDLLCVVCEFLNPRLSHSGLDHCLRRYGVGNLKELRAAAQETPHQPFKAYIPVFAYRRQVPAANGRRDTPPLPFRRHRLRHALGVRGDQAQQGSALGRNFFAGAGQSVPAQDPAYPHR
jgi:hypothetical protein